MKTHKPKSATFFRSSIFSIFPLNAVKNFRCGGYKKKGGVGGVPPPTKKKSKKGFVQSERGKKKGGLGKKRGGWGGPPPTKKKYKKGYCDHGPSNHVFTVTTPPTV